MIRIKIVSFCFWIKLYRQNKLFILYKIFTNQEFNQHATLEAETLDICSCKSH